MTMVCCIVILIFTAMAGKKNNKEINVSCHCFSGQSCSSDFTVGIKHSSSHSPRMHWALVAEQIVVSPIERCYKVISLLHFAWLEGFRLQSVSSSHVSVPVSGAYLGCRFCPAAAHRRLIWAREHHMVAFSSTHTWDTTHTLQQGERNVFGLI